MRPGGQMTRNGRIAECVGREPGHGGSKVALGASILAARCAPRRNEPQRFLPWPASPAPSAALMRPAVAMISGRMRLT